MQAGLVKVTGQDRDGRLHLDQQVSERLPRRRPEQADYPDLVGMSGHKASFGIGTPFRHRVAARGARIVRRW